MNIVSREQVLVSLTNLMIYDIHVRSEVSEEFYNSFPIETCPHAIAVACAGAGITAGEFETYTNDLLNKQLEITTDQIARANLQMLRDTALPSFMHALRNTLNANRFFFQSAVN
jgi:hypothetical protein